MDQTSYETDLLDIVKKTENRRRKIIDHVRNDKRAKAEIFEEIKRNIQSQYGGELTDREATEAARNLIGFFQIFLDAYGAKQREGLACSDEKV